MPKNGMPHPPIMPPPPIIWPGPIMPVPVQPAPAAPQLGAAQVTAEQALGEVVDRVVLVVVADAREVVGDLGGAIGGKAVVGLGDIGDDRRHGGVGIATVDPETANLVPGVAIGVEAVGVVPGAVDALLKGNHHLSRDIATRQIETSRKRVMEAVLGGMSEPNGNFNASALKLGRREREHRLRRGDRCFVVWHEGRIVHETPMPNVASPISVIVIRKAFLRPVRSPMRPKTRAPSGRTAKPAAPPALQHKVRVAAHHPPRRCRRRNFG